MHRFGRTAQQKMKDRWGGGFILATVLALAGAWYLGDYLSSHLGDQSAATEGVGSNTAGGISTWFTGAKTDTGNGSQAAMEPQEFQLFFVQVAALRSEAGASKLARTISDDTYTAMVAPKTTKDLHPVLVGPFTSQEAVTTAKSKLADGYQGAFPVSVTVAHNPDTVPATAMATMGGDMRKGLDVLNTYLHETAMWMESRSTGMTADAANLAKLGQQMQQYASMMQGEKDAKVHEFAAMADAASKNASAMQAAAAAMPSSDEYQSAMAGYMALLDQYRAFHNSK
jgi:hypothetical protein